ncbi:MAG: 2-oxoacid:acceptor oxidoreductase family protein [Candidatus Woesearchaeota archaeon]
MQEIFQATFHGRAGQGAKSAAEFLAEAAMEKNLYFQTFPFYGAEKLGAPVQAYVKLSKEKIMSYSPITEPDAVVVIDSTLLQALDVTKGLKKDGMLLVNTRKSEEEVKNITGFKGKVKVLDATSIALKNVKKNFPNMPMLGALIKLTNQVTIKAAEGIMKKHFLAKLGEEKTNANIKSLREGFDAF